MNPVAPLPAGISGRPTAAPGRTIDRAAREFEAVLLNTLLGSLEKTFSALPGQAMATGSDHFQYLGIQALSSSLAARGGLGIAEMISQSLAASSARNFERAQEKSLTRGASLERLF